jgi:hypothetical protein
MGAIVIRTRYDEDTESAEVAKSGVGYLSSSEAYTNNWGFFEKENYLAFDW